MNFNPKLSWPKRSVYLIAGCVLALTLLATAGRLAYRKWFNLPLTPEQVREVIWDYLQEQSGQSEFKLASLATNLPPATNEVLVITNKAGKVRTINAPKRRVVPPELELAKELRKEMTEANSYKAIYRVIGEQLAAAQKWLASTNNPEKESGLTFAVEAGRHAQTDACDSWLAARIVEGFLWPHLQWAESSGSKRYDPDALLRMADLAFREAGETNNLIRNYQMTIARYPTSGRADNARFRLAMLYEDQGELKAALKCLEQVQNTNNAKLLQRMELLRRRIR